MNVRQLLQLLAETKDLDSEVYIESGSTIYDCSAGSANDEGVFIILVEPTQAKFDR